MKNNSHNSKDSSPSASTGKERESDRVEQLATTFHIHPLRNIGKNLDK